MSLYITFGIVFASICAIVASNRNRSIIGWFFAGLLFGWLGLLVLALLPRATGEAVAATTPAAGPAQPMRLAEGAVAWWK
ncbi:MAG: hypothetical protein KBG28_13925 [Kofleriaceae bacterium]|jgi:hypothetical protein|nr:hypothetical protein [Kofleriaceae bacterium]MBP9205062.1 hypothetical protein [Kofleriaceae bacterium]